MQGLANVLSITAASNCVTSPSKGLAGGRLTVEAVSHFGAGATLDAGTRVDARRWFGWG